jgi:hypothetical protein
MRFKSILIILLLASAFSIVESAYAYENEPDGFRGVTWGAEYSDLTGFAPDGVSAKRLEGFARKGGPRFLTFPIVSYSKKDDKLEFANIPVTSVSYEFFKGKFIQVHINYFDGTNTRQGLDYLKNGLPGQKPPDGYGRKKDFDAALAHYFGKPTTSPNFFERSAGKTEVSYDGEVTVVTSICEGPSNSFCRATFESKKAVKEVLETWKGLIDNRVQEVATEQDALEKARAAVKAKPDF